MNTAIISQIISISAGVGTAGVAGVYVAAPHLLGIYSEVDIYAHKEVLTIENTSAAPEATVVEVAKEDKNTNNFMCYVTGISDTKQHFECSVYSITSPTPPKKYVNLNSATTKVEDINKIDTNTNYYKITVNQKLLWELQKSTTSTLSVTVKNKNNTTTKNLYPFLYSYQTYAQPIKTSDKDVKYFVGKAEKLESAERLEPTVTSDANNASASQISEITQTNTDGYECSYWKTEQMEQCSIYDLESTSTDVTELNTIQEFSKNTTTSAKIKHGNYYLIKDNKFTHQFFVQTKDNKTPKSMLKMTKLEEVFVFDKGSDVTLFHFSKSKTIP